VVAECIVAEAEHTVAVRQHTVAEGWCIVVERLHTVRTACKGNLTDLRRELHLSLAKGNPKLIYKG
jgi:hypothetical protein